VDLSSIWEGGGGCARFTSLASSLAVWGPGYQTCLVIVTWHCVGNCHLALSSKCEQRSVLQNVNLFSSNGTRKHLSNEL